MVKLVRSGFGAVIAKQIKHFYEQGIDVANYGKVFLKIKDLLHIYGMDDSTYYYCLNKEKQECPKRRRAAIIAKSINDLNTAIVQFTNDERRLKIRYTHMGYNELLPEINDVLNLFGIAPISASTLKRDMRKYNISTPWQMFFEKKSKSGTSCGKSDNKYVQDDHRAKLCYENLLEWNKGNVIHTNFLTNPFQLLCTDIKEFKWGSQRDKIYLTIIHDELSGEDVGHAISTGLTAEVTTIAALENLQLNYPNHSWLNTIIHSDRGSQMACKRYYYKAKGLGMIISMSPAGTPNRNPVAESRFSRARNNISKMLLEAKTEQEAIDIITDEIAVNNYDKRKVKCNYMTSHQFQENSVKFDCTNPEIISLYQQILIPMN